MIQQATRPRRAYQANWPSGGLHNAPQRTRSGIDSPQGLRDHAVVSEAVP
jgi:hypothetical protein